MFGFGSNGIRQNATYDEERSWNQMLGYGAHPLKQELHFVLMHFSLGKQAPECSRFGIVDLVWNSPVW